MPNGRAPSTPCCTQCSEPRTWCSNS
jgi:hypothetical protein